LCTQTPFNSRLTVFQGTTCAGLACVAGADNNCGNNESISWCSTANTVYYVLVHGGTGASGTFRLQVSSSSCNDNNACTTDSCSSVGAPTCVNSSTTPSTHCCTPSSGVLTVIEDSNPCTSDVCNSATGQVTHPAVPNAPSLACADTLRCTQDECFNGNCRNLDINTISCINTSDCPAGLGTTCISNLCRCIEDPTLDLVPSAGTLPNASCFSVGNILTVRVEMGFAPTPVVGSQFFLEYDLNTMTYIGTQPGRTVDLTSPFSFELQETVGIDGTTGFGTIDYAVAIPPGGAGGQNPATVAVITFQLSDECYPFLRFRAHSPPSQLLDANSNSFIPETTNMPPIQVNGTPPVLTGCPGNMSAGFDDGEFSGTVSFVPPTAMDGCDGAVSVTCNPPPGFAFPSGTTPVTCSAQNSCGVSASCGFNVTVVPSTVTVSMELSPSVSSAARQRCMTFDLWNCNTSAHEVVPKTVTFTSGLRVGEVVEIPGGDWTCITVRDTLHTLRSTAADLFTANTVNYTASFMGNPLSNGHWLIGGNLNDDGFIDIQDYVRFLAQYLASFPNPNTPCGTLPYHADINGSGTVDVADLSFVQIAMFTSREGGCCGATAAAEEELPMASITVKELYRKGLGHLTVGDLNGDDVLDIDDVALFLQQAPTLVPGELPKPIRTNVHQADMNPGEAMPTEQDRGEILKGSPGRRK
ncbi:MAG: HYR domain-containing protein, partial [Planctomycetota bacterium]